MIREVYLLWTSYSTNEILVIGKLRELDNKKYSFKYGKDAKKALSLGCFLPFTYTDEEIIFNSLPLFFEQRIIKGKFNSEKFGINYDINDKLRALVYQDSVKNNDNFKIVSEDKFNTKYL